MIKAIAGGGGRGMRIVDDAARLEEAYARCQSEAKAAFGSDGVYVERLIRNARHIEVQIIGDQHGAISHLWERECTIQRRNQKLIEVAPSPSLSDALARAHHRRRQAACGRRELRQSRHLRIPGRWRRQRCRDPAFAFIEANPRLQVEHTVTEEVLGLDLVQSQLAVAAGATLGSLGLAQAYIPKPRGFAMQLRVNMEVMDESGGTQADRRDARGVRPAVRPRRSRRYLWLFRLQDQRRLQLAARQGHRAFAGSRTGPTWCRRPRAPCASSGSAASPPTFRSSPAMLAHPDFVANRISTGFIDAHVAALVGAAQDDRAGDGNWSNPAAPPMTRRFALAVAASAAGPAGSVAGAGAAARHDRRHRGRGRRSGPSRPADRRARIHEDGASGDRAAWRQGDEGRGRKPA